MEEKNHVCPCCGRHCDLSSPSCERGAEYAKTGVIPERGHGGAHDHHGPRPHHGPFGGKSVLESDLGTDEKVCALLRELGHACRFGFEDAGKADRAGTGLLEPLSSGERETLLALLEKLSAGRRSKREE